MVEFLRLILHIMTSLFKPRTKLVAEILILRQQLNVLRRQVSKRPQLRNTDRFLFVWLYRWFPSVLSAIAILRPETIIRWHRAGFQSYCRGVSLVTSLSYSGPRHCVWRGLQAAVACHGHSGQADCSPIAVAESVRRETDRHDPTGMSRPHDRIWGGAPAPDSGSVCRVL